MQPALAFRAKTVGYTGITSIKTPTNSSMADEIDMANEQSERWLKQALSATAKTGPKLAPMGRCHHCNEPFTKTDELADKKLFCDADCASDYERENKLRNRR